MRFALSLVCVFGVVGACKAGDDYGVVPGGGGPIGGGSGSGSGVTDGPMFDPDAAAMGRVCVMSDPRDPTSCAGLGADGITVTLGNYQATTSADGSFVIQTTGGSGLVWHLSGSAIVPTVVPYSPSRTIPTISVNRYDQLLGDNGILFSDQEAAVFARVTQGGAVAVGATASATPPPTSAIFYDGGNATDWNQNATGAFGMVWIPQLDIQTGTSATATITPADTGGGSMPRSFPGIPLENLSITFVGLDLPPQ
jgi:hypothetical protein